MTLSFSAALHQLRGEAARTREVAERDLALATEQIIPFFAAHAMHGRFTEGFALPDLAAARSLLAELAAAA